MRTQCSAEQLQFSCVERRRVVARFDGGMLSSDAGALLLGRSDEAIGLIDRLAGCFIDERDPELIQHTVRTLIGQRVFGMALGYEDLNDHESLRHDPVFGALLGKLAAKRRRDCAGLAGKSKLNRLELHVAQGVSRYHKIRPDTGAIERLWTQLFLDAHREAGRHANCTRIFTAPVASARTVSKKRSWICLPIGSRARHSEPTNCGCGSPQLPMC